MPSGAKKRKAAKKKKEQAVNTINSSTNDNNNPHGNDDPKSQDERDSDGGDVGSPASQDDHNHWNPFSQGEEGGKGAPSPVQSYVTEDKPVEEANRDAKVMEKSGLDGVVDVKIDKELEFKNDLESSHVNIQHVKHGKSSSSSSELEFKNDLESSHVSIQHVKHDKSSTSSSSDDESQASEKKLKEEASHFVFVASSYVNGVNSEEALKVAENETLGDSDSISAVETAAVDNVVKAGLSIPEKVDNAAESVACDEVESELKESEEKLLPSSNGVSRVELEEKEGKISPSSGIPIAESSNVVDKDQDSGTSEYSEKQPLVASTPPVMRRTSVFSCCGLFDVFTGSGR